MVVHMFERTNRGPKDHINITIVVGTPLVVDHRTRM